MPMPRSRIINDSFEDGRTLTVDTVSGMVRLTISGGRYQGASFTLLPDDTWDIDEALAAKREEIRTEKL